MGRNKKKDMDPGTIFFSKRGSGKHHDYAVWLVMRDRTRTYLGHFHKKPTEEDMQRLIYSVQAGMEYAVSRVQDFAPGFGGIGLCREFQSKNLEKRRNAWCSITSSK
jgi:hypothetical protein